MKTSSRVFVLAHMIGISIVVTHVVYRGSYMSSHVLLNLLNELKGSYKMRGLPSILSLFRNEFDTFINTGATLNVRFYLSYDKQITLKSHFVIILSLCTQRCYGLYGLLILLHDIISLPDSTS